MSEPNALLPEASRPRSPARTPRPAPSSQGLPQGGVLADRYLETMFSDYAGTLLLLAQAPILAVLVVVAWSNLERADQRLYFVMILSCLWIGCMDACREIVKERSLFLRERMVNLKVGPYLMSKVRVLVLLNLVQVATYAGIIVYHLDMRMNVVALALPLLGATVTGTCLGLLVSSLVRRSDHAVGLVPLVILPQILFSEFAIGKAHLVGAGEVIFALMPSRWGYEALEQLSRTEPGYGEAVLDMLRLAAFCLVFLALSFPLLKLKRY